MSEKKLLWNSLVIIKKRIDWDPFVINMRHIKRHINLSEVENKDHDFLIFNGKDFVPFSISIEEGKDKSFISFSTDKEVPLSLEKDSYLYVDDELKMAKEIDSNQWLKYKNGKTLKILKIKEYPISKIMLEDVQNTSKIFKIKVDWYLDVNWYLI